MCFNPADISTSMGSISLVLEGIVTERIHLPHRTEKADKFRLTLKSVKFTVFFISRYGGADRRTASLISQIHFRNISGIWVKRKQHSSVLLHPAVV